MARYGYKLIFTLLVLVCSKPVLAFSKEASREELLAARLEAATQKRLSPDDFRRLTLAFSAPVQKINIGYSSDSESRYLVCIGVNASAGISFAGTGLCSDMSGRLYGLEFGMPGLGLDFSGVIWAGYWVLDNSLASSISRQNGQHIFNVAGGGGAYFIGGRAICAWGKGESKLCLLGLEVGAGVSAGFNGYLMLTER